MLPAGVVPFPKLRVLSLHTLYPFANDVLFRGNAATLEYLEFKVDPHIVDIINRSQELDGKHSVLRHVIVHRCYNSEEQFNTSEVDKHRFIGILARVAKRLVVSAPMFTGIPAEAVQHGYSFMNIQAYDTGFYTLSLFTTLSLFKALPSLVNLKGGIGGLGEELEHMASAELPDYVATEYGPLKTKMKVWAIGACSSQGKTNVVDYILLLALVCPELYRIEGLSGALSGNPDAIAKALSGDVYGKYESHLNWLLRCAHD
ncbi:hypothetical protein IWW39_000659 [Coemansia spiralis]|uniref:Uncharacterized protein n=1 Tax=Coemansia spiralis TaxID=417178 RepID=A0A9W8L580_9FUNG|nr:hypothetical protein IWW39_000659 [Coemansia spiralis]